MTSAAESAGGPVMDVRNRPDPEAPTSLAGCRPGLPGDGQSGVSSQTGHGRSLSDMDDLQVDAYLARIGAGRPARVDAEALRDLQVHHLYAVPFENLGIHLGEPVSLDEGALVEKLVHRRRGGFCYELNGAFACLLSALGFTVTLLAPPSSPPPTSRPPSYHLPLSPHIS